MTKSGLTTAFALAVLAGGMTSAGAQNPLAHGITVAGNHAKMMMVPQSALPFIAESSDDSAVVTIFSNLASKYPKGPYWCCSGYNVMGPNSGAGEQWIAAAFTPDADHTVTRIELGAGWSEGTNGIVISLNEDRKGVPGKALRTWNVSGLPFFGTCCTVLKVSTRNGIPVSGGRQYWILLSTSGSETDTVDAWNESDADQVDQATLASYSGNQWHVFQTAPGVAFTVKGR
jgi:hypothetical protein